MKKYINLKITLSELVALCESIDSLSALMDEDTVTKRDIKKIDKMLLRNKYKRKYN